MKRATWDEYFMAMAWVVEQRSPAEYRSGVVLVDEQKRVLSCGYAGYVRGLTHPMKFNEELLVHAVPNALANSLREPGPGCTLYATRAPCPECLKLLVQWQIMEIIVPRGTQIQHVPFVVIRQHTLGDDESRILEGAWRESLA